MSIWKQEEDRFKEDRRIKYKPRISNGGSAFPHTAETLAHPNSGITKLDYFAAAALTGIMANNVELDSTAAAKLAYRVAEAMLTERTVAEFGPPTE